MTDSALPPWIFTLSDLHEFPEGSLPSPYGIINPVRRLPPGLRLLAVGWLDGPIEFAKGETHPEVVSNLLRLGPEFLIDEGTRSDHSCYYCTEEDFEAWSRSPSGEWRRGAHRTFDYRPRSPMSHGHHLVRMNDVVYMFPALLPHYIVVHGYRPPDVFREAVLAGAFIADADLVHTGEDFLEVVYQRSLERAEAAGNDERAAHYRDRIAARRDELRREGKTSGWRDRDTGVWRDEPNRNQSPPSAQSPSSKRPPHPERTPFDRVLVDRSDAEEGSGWVRRFLGGLAKMLGR